MGAGASKEAAFPLGLQLAQEIGAITAPRNTDESMQFFNTIRAALHTGDHNHLIGVCGMIHAAMPFATSIDDYIDNAGDPLIAKVAKMAIVHQILKAERESPLFESVEEGRVRNASSDPTLTTWYHHFWRQLSRDTKRANLDEIFDGVRIINFNYDRSLEQFLTSAVRNYYGTSWNEAAAVVSKCPMVRPYGSLGPIRGLENCIADFGDEVYPQQLLQMSNGIRTYTEQIEDKDALHRISEYSGDSRQMVFLGFGFHDQNLKLLRAGTSGELTILGTAFGESDYNIRELQQRLLTVFSIPGSSTMIGRILAGDPQLDDVSCGEFFDLRRFSLIAKITI